MVGPVRTKAGASDSSKDGEGKIQPPRPANAWIKYRSHKYSTLRLDAQRMSQGDVSKIISAMWKDEDEQVKRQFEQLAEEEKLMHQQLYPDYRFRPQKKGSKSKGRRAKKPNARDATAADALPLATPPGMPPPMPFQPQLPPNLAMQQPIFFPPEVFYGRYGPSPPMSAAPSPAPQETFLSPNSSSDETAASSSSATSDSQASSPSSHSPPNQLYIPSLPSSRFPPNAYVAQPPSTLPAQSSTPSEQPPNPLHAQGPSSGVVVTPAATTWKNFPVSVPNFASRNTEMVKINVAIPQPENGSGFQPAVPGPSQLSDILSPTKRSRMFNLSTIDTQNIVVQPPGDLRVAMGTPASTVDYTNQLFTDYDFIEFQKQLDAFRDGGSNPSKPNSSPARDELASLFQCSNGVEAEAYTAAQQRQPSGFTQDMMSYLNFDAVEETTEETSAVSSVSAPTTVAPQQVYLNNTHHAEAMPILSSMTNMTTVSPTPASSYMPPAGAVNSSTRRVAASWKPPYYIPEQTEDPFHSWAIPTNQ